MPIVRSCAGTKAEPDADFPWPHPPQQRRLPGAAARVMLDEAPTCGVCLHGQWLSQGTTTVARLALLLHGVDGVLSLCPGSQGTGHGRGLRLRGVDYGPGKGWNMAGGALFAITVWIALTCFYLLFAGQASMSEMIAGVPSGAMATCFAVLLRQARSRPLRLQAPWPRVVGRPLVSLFPDAVWVRKVLLSVLWRRPGGAIGMVSHQPCRHGGNDAANAGRRGLVTLGLSLAPNGYVLSIPDHQDVLLMHRLVAAAPDPDAEWPA